MTNTSCLKIIESLLFALLVSQSAAAADLSKLDVNGSLTATQKAKMANGGSDSGGGQGVYDMRTGQLHFVDLYTREELQQMQLSPNPQREVFAKFPNCTKVLTTQDQYGLHPAHLAAQRILYGLAAQVPFPEDGYDFVSAMHLLVPNSTAMRLRQLKDATIVAPQYQIQLAIYRNDLSAFQSQLLDLLPRAEAPYLFIKEVLRHLAKQNMVHLENSEIEAAVRLIYRQDFAGFLESKYYRKLMRPMFLNDMQPTLEDKEKYAVDRLNNPNISFTERAMLESDLFALQCWKGVEKTNLYGSKDWTKKFDTRCGDPNLYRHMNILKILPPEYKSYFGDNDKGSLYERIFMRWNQVFPMPLPNPDTRADIRKAPAFYAFNNVTGKLERDIFNQCSPDVRLEDLVYKYNNKR
jgi:hypothetical protein